MQKTPITRAELASRVLAGMREHQACLGVLEIAITAVDIEGHGRTWHVNVVDCGGSSPQVSMSVARTVTETLEPLFELID